LSFLRTTRSIQEATLPDWRTSRGGQGESRSNTYGDEWMQSLLLSRAIPSTCGMAQRLMPDSSGNTPTMKLINTVNKEHYGKIYNIHVRQFFK
jgi:hypothetical protein